jgi:parvulin-like peptidyl-prolyl isomerase
MKAVKLKNLCLFILICVFVLNAMVISLVHAAQTISGAKRLQSGIADYGNGKYDDAVFKLEMAVYQIEAEDKDKLWKAHFYLGLSYHLTGDNDEARKQFIKAQDLLKSKLPDPSIHSPKVVRLFREAGNIKEQKTSGKEIIAIVNGENILRPELDRILDKSRKRMGNANLHLLEEKIINDLITQAVLKQFIKKENIHIDPDRVENEIETFRENIRKNPQTRSKNLETLLEEQGGSIEELRVALDISFSIDEYMEKTIPEEEIEKYFTENTGNFNGETVTASHILIDTKGVEDKTKLKEAKARIDRIKEELDGGADFAQLAKAYSDCPSAKAGGDLGPIKRGEMVKKFTDVAYATEVNGISDPVKTQFGYHIIKVTGKNKGIDVNFEEIRDKVKIALHNEKTLGLIQELLKESEVKVLYTPTPYYTK